MNGNSFCKLIYIRIGSTLVKALTCYDIGSSFESTDRQSIFLIFFFSLFFNVQTYL